MPKTCFKQRTLQAPSLMLARQATHKIPLTTANIHYNIVFSTTILWCYEKNVFHGGKNKTKNL